MIFVVNQGKVNKWRNCHQAYHYRYVEELVPRATRRPFYFGTLIHRMIEYQSEGTDPFLALSEALGATELLKLFEAEKEDYRQSIEDARVIMTEYFAYWQPRDLRLVAVSESDDGERYTEHEFAIDLMPGVIWKGQIDAIGITPNKLRWMVENKSFDKLPSDDHRWRNIQSVTYIEAIERLGWLKRVDGVCWNYVKSKPPTIPQLLKNGKELSIRDIVTLPSVVMATLKQHKLNPEEPKNVEIMERAEATRHEYFQRIFTPVNRTVFKNIFSGFVDSAKEMRKYHGSKKDKNLGRHCEWCDYEQLCRAEMTGGDVDFLKEREYKNEDPEAHRRTARSKGAEGVTREKPGGKATSKLRVLR